MRRTTNFAQEQNAQPESELQELVFRPSILADLPLFIVVDLIFILSIFATIYYYPNGVEWIDLFTIGTVKVILPIPLYVLGPLVLFGLLIHKLFDSKYIISKDYIRAISGILSFHKQDIRLEFMDIRGMEIHRGLYGRIVNTGILTIGTAMIEQEEMVIENIYNPSFYRDEITKRRDLVNSRYIMRPD